MSQPEGPVTEAAAPETAATTPEAPAPAVPVVSAEDIAREKLAVIRERRAEQRARIEASQATKAREEALTSRARLDAERWAKDPVAAMQDAKLDPRAALDALVKHVTEDDAPVTRAELREREAKIDALERRLAAQEAREEAAKAEAAARSEAAAVAAQEDRLMGLMEGPEFADLRRVYPREQILHAANSYATQLHESGQRFTLESIAAALLKRHEDMASRYRPAEPTSAPESAPRKTVNGGRTPAVPRTLTTDLATEPGARVKKPETMPERLKRLQAKYG